MPENNQEFKQGTELFNHIKKVKELSPIVYKKLKENDDKEGLTSFNREFDILNNLHKQTFDLDRFIDGQKSLYLSELKRKEKDLQNKKEA